MENTSPMDAAASASSSNEASEQPMNMVSHAIEALKASEEPKAPETPTSSSTKKEGIVDDVEMKAKENEKEEEKEEKKEEKKKTMADFGYCFRDGKMRTIEGDAGFTFTTQKEYEALGDAIGEVVYEMMEKEGLERRWVALGRGRRFYFASPGYAEKERILVLIHGSGVVKAGQWARKLIINESLSRGTQLDYIKRGLANGWGIVVLNYNEQSEGRERSSHDSRENGLVEWAHAFEAVKGDADILIVAHSYGGDIASQVVHRMHKSNDDRVLLVCLTDSWFSSDRENEVRAVNWNTNKTMRMRKSMGTWQMYSGDDTHEGTSAACINSCFALMEAVKRDTSEKEFEEMLKKSEEIVFDEYKEVLKRKKEEQRAKDVQARLEFEKEMKEKEEKKGGAENEKNEDGENKSEGAKKETAV